MTTKEDAAVVGIGVLALVALITGIGIGMYAGLVPGLFIGISLMVAGLLFISACFPKKEWKPNPRKRRPF